MHFVHSTIKGTSHCTFLFALPTLCILKGFFVVMDTQNECFRLRKHLLLSCSSKGIFRWVENYVSSRLQFAVSPCTVYRLHANKAMRTMRCRILRYLTCKVLIYILHITLAVLSITCQKHHDFFLLLICEPCRSFYHLLIYLFGKTYSTNVIR